MKPKAPGADAECTSCGKQAGGEGGGDIQKVLAPVQLKKGAAVQRDVSDYVPQVVKDVASKAGEVISEVLPDSIKNLLTGKKGEAESVGTDMESKADTAVSAARTEGEGVEGQAQTPADDAVTSAQE